MPEGVFQAADEVLGGLPEHRFAVAFAAVAQDDAKDVRLATLPVAADDRGPAAEIDLGLFAWLAFHAAKGQFARPAQPPHEPHHAPVAAREAVLVDQVLIDPPGVQSLIELASRSPSAEAHNRCDRYHPAGGLRGASAGFESPVPVGACVGFGLPSREALLSVLNTGERTGPPFPGGCPTLGRYEWSGRTRGLPTNWGSTGRRWPATFGSIQNRQKRLPARTGQNRHKRLPGRPIQNRQKRRAVRLTDGSGRSDCEPLREVIEKKLDLGLHAKRIHQDLVDEHGFRAATGA